MRFISCLCFMLFPCGWVYAEEKPRKLEPRCLAIEPIALRSSVSRTIPGSRVTAIVPAREEELGIAHLTAEEFEEAGYTWAEYQEEGEAAAARLLETINSVVERDPKGKAIRATLRSESHLTASVFLCKQFYARFSKIFGEHLVVLIPDHFTVYIFPRAAPDFQKYGRKVMEEYRKAIWPCSQEAFEVGPVGIRCLGTFDDGSVEPLTPLPPGSAESMPMTKQDSPKAVPAESRKASVEKKPETDGTEKPKAVPEPKPSATLGKQPPAKATGSGSRAGGSDSIPLPPAELLPQGGRKQGNSLVPVRKR